METCLLHIIAHFLFSGSTAGFVYPGGSLSADSDPLLHAYAVHGVTFYDFCQPFQEEGSGKNTDVVVVIIDLCFPHDL